ncbi:hypothetical protein GCM10009819_09080 [Agromyces tropicus]|uniref:DUF998 domain-containing protein n=1 Tax=Agromyces tropicus TaxID=555371 RepID=A0ABN2U3G2_9MICO
MSAPMLEGRAVDVALRAFPAAFRDQYGHEMRVLARDTVRDAQADGTRAVRAARARIVFDLLLAAAMEHTRKESAMHVNGPGVGYGIAAAIGLPLIIASYSSAGFWSFLSSTGVAMGVESSSYLVHPSIVLIGGILMTVGLIGLVGRLSLGDGPLRWLRAAAIVGGVLVTLGGASMYAYGLPSTSPWRGALDTAGVILLGPGLLLVLGLLVAAGVIALRTRSLGALSFAPMAVAACLVLVFAVMITVMAIGVPIEVGFRQPAMVIADWLLFGSSIVLGVALALAPQPATHRPRRPAAATA